MPDLVKPPSAMARAIQRVRYEIKGVSDAWFGPMQPLRPQAQEAKGRTWDYPVAFNLNYRPRANMALSFADLQGLSDNCTVLRSVIETRKDQIEALDWEIHPRKSNGKSVKPSADQQARIDYATKLFCEPNKDHDWGSFIRQFLEQHFVFDAPAFEMVPNRSGQLCGIKILDGSTISVMLDEHGTTPAPPYVAYQQILKGLPAVDFTSDELLYAVRNRRPGYAYGFPHVAQIYQHVQLALKRVQEQSAAYDGANAPHGVMEAAATMTVDQITAMQTYWDSMFTGNITNRAKTWWVPSGSKYTALSREILFDEFDEWLARVICYCFSISPTPFIKQNNRATAESSHDMALAEGTKPTLKYTKRVFDRMLAKWMNSSDLEFVWQHEDETDPSKIADINTKYITAGIMSIDEGREAIGRDAFGGAAATPLALTGQGYVPVDPSERTQMATDAANQQAETQAKLMPKLPPGAGRIGPDGKPLPPALGGAAKPAGALPAPAKGQVPNVKGPAAAAGKTAANNATANLSKVEDAVEVYEVSRPVLNKTELAAWVSSLGLAPVEDMVVRSVVTETRDSLPFTMAENYYSMLVKDDDGFVLYFDVDPFDEPTADMPSIRVTGPSDTSADDVAGAEFSDPLLFGPETVEKRWDVRAHDANLNPTAGQKDAGNYQLGHIQFQGLNLSIENPAGSARRGPGWKTLMPVHYGYIKGTVGADGDHVDAFVGDNPESDTVYVIDQNANGKFDEHKVMLGFDSWTAARTAYENSFSDGLGHTRISNAVMLPMEKFKTWLKTGDTTQPISLMKSVTLGTGLVFYDQGVPKKKDLKKPEDDDDGITDLEVKKRETIDLWARY